MIVYHKVNGVPTPVTVGGKVLDSPDWTFSGNDMDASTMTLNVVIDASVVPQFDYDWFVEFEGEKYTLSNKKPNATKNDSQCSIKYVLSFGDSSLKLKNFIFRDIQYYSANSQLSYSSSVNFVGTIKDLCSRLQLNFDACFGVGNFVVDLVSSIADANIPYEQWKTISFNDATFWDVVKQIYDIFKIRWKLTTQNDVDTLKIGYPTETLDHVFEYGGGVNDKTTQGGLSSLTVAPKSDDVITRLIGVGGTENIPVNYFTLYDNKFLTDNVYTARRGWYKNLLPKSFRMYVFGNNDSICVNGTPTATPIFNLPAIITQQTFIDWNTAYKTYNNGQFTTIDFDDECVLDTTEINEDWDDISTKPFAFKAYIKGWNDYIAGDFNPICWAESTNKAQYGIREGVLESNEQIKPSIIEVTRPNIGRIDEIVDAEQIDESLIQPFTTQAANSAIYDFNVSLTGDAMLDAKNEIFVKVNLQQDVEFIPPIDKNSCQYNFSLHCEYGSIYTYKEFELTLEIKKFIGYNAENTAVYVNDLTVGGHGVCVSAEAVIEDNKYKLKTADAVANFSHFFSESNAFYIIELSANNRFEVGSRYIINNLERGNITANNFLRFECVGTINPISSQTFNVWVKDIGFDLTNTKYWGTEDAVISFNTGALAGEYDFKIIRRGTSARKYLSGVQVFEDTSKSIVCDVDGVQTTVNSKYRIKIQRSDADYDATGLLLPNTYRNVKAGDLFYFANINLPFEYVYYAEEKYDKYIREQLAQVDSEIPEYTFELDNQYVNNVLENSVDAGKLKAGNNIKIKNTTLIGDEYITSTINTITKTPTKTNVK